MQSGSVINDTFCNMHRSTNTSIWPISGTALCAIEILKTIEHTQNPNVCEHNSTYTSQIPDILSFSVV